MDTNTELMPLLRIPETVREDVLAYREKVNVHLRGETTAVAFKAQRVPMGIYEQRAAGRYMVRVRLGAGFALPRQLEQIAALSKKYGNGVLHVTTRQDIQIHDVAIEDTPDVIEALLTVGLSTRGGGGNTVRNVSACPRSGSCPKERFDVAPYAIATAEYLLQHRSSFNLPRKFKAAFSGCGHDCALASVADVGFFAKVKEGVKGFLVFAGGGMGSNARGGIRIEEFAQPEQVLEIAEAVRRLFDRHGDRLNRHKARLRYVLNRLGDDGFRQSYQAELDAVRAEGLLGEIPSVRDLAERFPREPKAGLVPAQDNIDAETRYPGLVLAEKDPDLVTVRLAFPLGDVSADDLIVVARAAEEFGSGFVRATQRQELLIPGCNGNLAEMLERLESISVFNEIRKPRPRIVACAGASTCKLGLCLSRRLATAITERVDALGIEASPESPVIHISGCPNGCGAHYVASIGLEGRAERHKGRLMPAYVVMAGGKPSKNGARIAEPIGAVPAKRVPDMIAEALAHNIKDADRLRALVSTYGAIPEDPPEDYFRDFGETTPFSLAGRGPGECGAGVFDVIQVDIHEAARSVETARKEDDANLKSEALYRALLAGARSLLVIFGLELHKDREIFAAFDRELIAPGWVASGARELVNAALDWKMGDQTSLAPLSEPIADLIARLRELFGSLDSNLKFRASPLVEEGPAASPPASAPAFQRVDLRGVACPMNFVKAKVALEKVPVGAVLEVVLDDGPPIKNVPASFTEQGQEVLAIEPFEGRHLLRIRRSR